MSEQPTADEPMSPSEEELLVSPEGMKMRSGKKKRRRSMETTGLTPDEEVQKKRQKRGAKKDDEEEEMDKEPDEEVDEEMKEEGEEDEEDAKPAEKPRAEDEPSAAVAAKKAEDELPTTDLHPPVVFETATAPKKVPPIETLRLPSQHTPGKPLKETKLQVIETPYDKPRQQREDLQEPPSVERNTAAADAILADPPSPPDHTPVKKLWASISHTIHDMILPAQQGLEIDEDSASDQSSLVYSAPFWFFFFLVLQVALYPLWINPVMTGVSYLSEQSILTYKTLLGVPPTVIESYTRVEVPVAVRKDQATTGSHEAHIELMEHIHDLEASRTSFASSFETLDVVTKEMEDTIESISASLEKKKESLKAWDEALSKSEEQVRALLDLSPQELAERVQELDLNDLEDVTDMKLPTKVMYANIPMWEVVSSSTGCLQPPSNEEDTLVTDRDVRETIQDMRVKTQEAVFEMTKDPNVEQIVKEFVNDELDELGVPLVKVEGDSSDTEGTDDSQADMTEEEAKKIINERLEINLAENMGIFDVVAIYNGAEVITSGPRATTPSLVQSLPLLNRLMAATKLRFYGHGPQAALMPGAQSGQCWSFENVASSRNPRWSSVFRKDNSNGQYASLTVRLAKAVTIGRVILEHPSDHASSAIQDFRLVGYADDSARGEPVHLGSFTFNNQDGSTQEFAVSVSHEMVKSLTLAIDNTYSPEYSCLYRFRVMEI
jgi:hypothetical protein